MTGKRIRSGFRLSPEGWLKQAKRIVSPNFDERPENTTISLIVIHAISLPPESFGGPGIVQLFTNTLNPAAHPYYQTIHTFKVSSHFLIRRNGAVLQFVPCAARAWHAGESTWRGQSRCNDFSIGIELEGSDNVPFSHAQYRALKRLTISLKNHYPITDITGHSNIAPARKTDPGPFFDWSKLETA